MAQQGFHECAACGTGFVGVPRVRVSLHRAHCGRESMLWIAAAAVAGSSFWLLVSDLAE